jgi:hypothetical protein
MAIIKFSGGTERVNLALEPASMLAFDKFRSSHVLLLFNSTSSYPYPYSI